MSVARSGGFGVANGGGFDTHAHIFPPHTGIAGARYIPSYGISKEDFLGRLESAGFLGGVLVQPSFLGYDNSLLLQAVRGDSRLRGVVMLGFDTGRSVLEEYARAGIVGVRLNLIGGDLESALTEIAGGGEFLAVCRDLGWHVEVHRGLDDVAQVAHALLQQGVKVVIDHLGRPSVAGMRGGEEGALSRLCALRGEGELWFKVSGFYRFGGEKGENLALARRVYEELLGVFGVGSFVYGSDYPHTNFEDSASYLGALESFLHIVREEGERRAILGENARRLFGF